MKYFFDFYRYEVYIILKIIKLFYKGIIQFKLIEYDFIYNDIYKLIDVKSFNGSRFFITFIYNKTKYDIIYFIKF